MYIKPHHNYNIYTYLLLYYLPYLYYNIFIIIDHIFKKENYVFIISFNVMLAMVNYE